MKIPSSSPSRTEKFPPPLMRFLRSNGGSKSRGRSSLSPIFIRKKNLSTIETQEPSSPKVTCMGQVQVIRCNKQNPNKNGRTRRCSCTKKWYNWFQKSLFTNCFSKKCNLESSSPVSSSWFSFFRHGFHFSREELKSRREVEETEEEREAIKQKETEEEKEDEERESNGFVLSAPPKNALILMRCRSDPCRNSSMLNRFSDSSSTTNQDSEQKNRAQVDNEEEQEQEIEVNPRLKPKPIYYLDSRDPETKEKNGFYSEICSNGSINYSKTIKIREEVKKVTGGISLTLTRCKSEATRRKSMRIDSSSLVRYV